mgnify:CR=1 FL=1
MINFCAEEFLKLSYKYGWTNLNDSWLTANEQKQGRLCANFSPTIFSLALTKLLQEEKVAVVPGSAFGASGEGFIRCSYAYSIEELREALTRIARFVKKVSLHNPQIGILLENAPSFRNRKIP